MNTELNGVVLIILLIFILAYPLGKYIRKYLKAKKFGVIFFPRLKNLYLKLVP